MLEERREKIAGFEIFWREAPSQVGGVPTLYVHGVPVNADEWTPFLERTGGVALDLPGHGQSPGARGDWASWTMVRDQVIPSMFRGSAYSAVIEGYLSSITSNRILFGQD